MGARRSPPHKSNAYKGNSAKTPTPLSCVTTSRLQPEGHPTHINVVRLRFDATVESVGIGEDVLGGDESTAMSTAVLIRSPCPWMPCVPRLERTQGCLFANRSPAKNPSRSRVPRQAVKKEPQRIRSPGAAGLRRLPLRSLRLAAKNPPRWTPEADSSRSRASPKTFPGVGGATG
jgi:hypothetical protein